MGEENDRIGKTQSPTDQPTSELDKSKPKPRVIYGNLPRIAGREALLKPEHSESHAIKPSKKHCYTRDPGMFWVGVATLAAIIIYACYAREQAKSMADAVIEQAKAVNEQRISNAQTREAFQASHRPEVNIGRPDGKLAEFRRSGQNENEIIMYFSNSGTDPALNFHADIFSTSPNHQTVPSRHIARFVDLDPRHYPFAVKPGGAGILVSNIGVNLPSGSVRGVVVPPISVPSRSELKRVRRNQSVFWIIGTTEYCTQFGVLVCSHFIIKYEPLIDFIALENENCTGTIPPASPSEITQSPETKWLIPLPRCEQPQERAD